MNKLTDARGHDLTFGYGGSTGAAQGEDDQLTSVTRTVDTNSAHNQVWQFNYSPASGTGDRCTATGVIARTVETDPEGHLTTYCDNADGQVVQTFDANHRSVQASYTAQANVATFTGLAGTANPSLSTYSFNANGSATGSSTAVGSNAESTTISYCGTGTQPACSTSAYPQFRYLPTATSDTQGTPQAFSYNGAGDLTDVTTTSGSDHQQMHYTSAGEVDWSKDGNGNQTTYDYTTVSHFLSRVTPPSPLAVENFGADGIDRVAWGEDGNRVFSCVTYDGEDRTTRVDYKTGSCTGTTVKWMTFTFDDNGNLTQRVDDAGNTTTYTYDYANRRTSETFPSSRTNTYSYDRSSNLTSLVDNDGTTFYTYDPANRLRTVTSPKPGGGTDAITYDYTDPASSSDPSTQTITFPGGLKQVSTVDAAGNVLSVKATNSSGTVLDKRDYSYLHTVGSAASVSAMIQTMTDSAGNVTTYTPGAAERMRDVVTTNGSTAVEEWHYTYDAAGSRTLRQHRTGAGSMVNNSYGYNTANELCYSVSGTPTGTCAAPPTGATTYTYDNDGQRLGSTPTAAYDNLERLTTLNGTSLSYLSPGNGELMSYGTSTYQNNLLGTGRLIPSSGSATDLIRTPNGATIAQRVGTTSKQDLFTDALGSTFATADDNATTLAKRYTYDPDGNATGTGTGTTPSVLYAGGIQIGGLYHYGARYYDPNTATWTQQDPLNQISSLTQANHYTYAGGDPVDSADPTGLFALSAGISVGPFSASVSVGKGGVSVSGSAGASLSLGAGVTESDDVGDSGFGVEGVNPCVGICRNDEYTPGPGGTLDKSKGPRYLGGAIGGFNYTGTLSTK
jgi:RHS repeat-associated protein